MATIPPTPDFTPEQTDMLRCLAVDALSRRCLLTQVYERLKLSGIGGDVPLSHYRTIVEMAQADIRARHATRVGLDPRDMAVDFYESVIRDPQADIDQKLKAQGAIDRLLGLLKQSSVDVDDDYEAEQWFAKEIAKRANERLP